VPSGLSAPAEAAITAAGSPTATSCERADTQIEDLRARLREQREGDAERAQEHRKRFPSAEPASTNSRPPPQPARQIAAATDEGAAG